MKNTLQMIAILLLVSSCGLFKKTLKSKASEHTVVTEKIGENFQVERDTGEMQVVQSYAGALTKEEDVIQIEGEGIQITRDGVVRLHSGKIYQKKNVLGKRLETKERFDAGWKGQKMKSSQQSDKKLELLNTKSKSVMKPATTSMLYFTIGLGVLVALAIWLIRKGRSFGHW
ncbi:MAG: hypothetical protein LBJ04_24860 [Sphingobacterium sp.]|uniref:hypothetical protein n=1 Tax=Sphingobacterium sp. TaxID=341027 RepID=UPI00282BEFC4|nr:hypothetical protein [Sphingobacterium sp.]MDR0266468.1 hypothetical protein [Sphingobacterium sp.]